jgi:hypothetical protein
MEQGSEPRGNRTAVDRSSVARSVAFSMARGKYPELRSPEVGICCQTAVVAVDESHMRDRIMQKWKTMSGNKPFLVKGIQSVDDAKKAVELGVDGIVCE